MRQAFYVVHADDVGKNPKTVRCVATAIPEKGQTEISMEEFLDYLEITGCAFRAAMVNDNGELVHADPRHFE